MSLSPGVTRATCGNREPQLEVFPFPATPKNTIAEANGLSTSLVRCQVSVDLCEAAALSRWSRVRTLGVIR